MSIWDFKFELVYFVFGMVYLVFVVFVIFELVYFGICGCVCHIWDGVCHI